jgi:diaminopimelate epimerase
LADAGGEIGFHKYTALGNDYLVLAEKDIAAGVRSADVARLCDRRFGVGADGILLTRPPAESEPFSLRIFNSDGSECERSGNGLRIFSQWLVDSGAVGASSFEVRCQAGTSTVEVHSDGTISVEMGTADFSPSASGIADAERDCTQYALTTSAGELDVTSVSVGNPHTIVFTELAPATRARLGAEIARHPLFLHGTNVQFLTDVADEAITIEIWERGSGATLASGSSACAAVSATYRRGLTGGSVTVHMPGGDMLVAVRDGGVIWQRGRADRVFSGSVHYPPCGDAGDRP